MKWIARATAATLASGLMVALALLGLWIADAGGRSAQADSGLEVGVDANPLFYPANTDTSVGTAEPCISRTSTGGTFDVDIYVRDVTNLMSFALTFEYDPDIVHVSAYDVQRFLAVGSTNVLDMSDCPGATGYCGLGAFDADKLNHFGDGVLATVTLDPQGPAGISPADLTGVELTDTQGDPIGGADIVNSEVGIDQPSSYCVPDEDLDGVPDDDDLCLGTPPDDPVDAVGCSRSQVDPDLDDLCSPSAPPETTWCSGTDNCPNDYNPSQTDTDGDDLGDACDDDADADGFPNSKEDYHGSDWLNTMCQNAMNDDPSDDSRVNDGCPPVNGAPEIGSQCLNPNDDDNDGKVNDGCPLAGTSSEGSFVEVCDGLDNDGDTEVDEGYDRNPVNGIGDCLDAVDTDGDTVLNPDEGDDDNDYFSDAVEAWTGTDSLDGCSENPDDDAWTPDFNNDCIVNVLDLVKFRSALGTGYGYSGSEGSLYRRRPDLNGDGVTNVLDLVLMRPHMGTMGNDPPGG